MPSADQDNSDAYNGFQHEKHLVKDKLDYDVIIAVKMHYIVYFKSQQVEHEWKSVIHETM